MIPEGGVLSYVIEAVFRTQFVGKLNTQFPQNF